MFKKLKDKLLSRKIASIAVILIIILAIPLTVIISQKQQNIVQKAAELSTPENLQSREIQNLTNELLGNLEKIGTNTFSSGSTKKATIEDSIGIAKKRKELLLKMLEINPQDFINNATLVTKAMPQEIKEYVEHKIDTQGELVVLHFDNFDAKKSKFEYYIKTNKKYKLHFVQNPPRAYTDTKIRVTGIMLDNNIALLGSSNQGQYALQIIAQATLPPTMGEQKIAVILTKFTTDTSQPIASSTIKQFMFQDTHSTNSVDSFYKENSFNKISFSGDVFGWYTVQPPANCYDLETVAKDAAIAAGVQLGNFNRIVFVFSNDQNCYPFYGGYGTIGGNPSYSSIFYPESANTYAHELGHNVGQHHANLFRCGNTSIDIYQNCINYEYADQSDVMGSGFFNHFNGPHKVAVGWIPENNMQKITSDGIYTITHIETTTTNPQILQIYKPDTDESYYISYRQPIGYDSTIDATFTRGASLHVWDNDNFTQTKLLSIYPNTYAHTFIDNGVFFNPMDGLEIKQLNHNNTSVTLAIRFGVGITPTPIPPPSENGKIIYKAYNTNANYIYTILPDGTQKKIFPVLGRNSYWHPVFSADGKQVALYFYNNLTNSGNIVIYDYKVNHINEIITPQSTYLDNFIFTPDGKSLFVSASAQEAGVNAQSGGGGSSKYSIYRIDTNGANKQIIIPPTELYTKVAAVFSDGKKILFTKSDYYSNMYLVNIDGANLELIGNPYQSVFNPALSPDNKFIVYEVWGISLSAGNGSNELYKFDLATKEEKKIPINLSGNKYLPSFSPDGKQLVFLNSTDSDTDSAIYRVNLDGSNLQQIATEEYINLGQPAWAPDPDFITPTPTITPSILPTNTPAPTVTPTPTPTPKPGDIDGDGKADIIDFNIWRCEFLGDGVCTAPASNKKADLNKDTFVDLLDFVLWRNEFVQ